MEYWNDGVIENWSIGILELWSNGFGKTNIPSFQYSIRNFDRRRQSWREKSFNQKLSTIHGHGIRKPFLRLAARCYSSPGRPRPIKTATSSARATSKLRRNRSSKTSKPS